MIQIKYYTCFNLLFLLICLTARTEAQVIPAPLSIEMQSGTFQWDTKTKLYTNLEGEAKEMMDEYLTTLSLPIKKGGAKDNINVVRLIISPLVQVSDKEAYQLKVTPGKIEVTANTETGLFYGMQTLLQISSASVVPLTIQCVDIVDKPRFGYRGFMLDVSRHFFPKTFILKMLDILAYYKINVFHFHLVDTGGWRIETDSYPNLTEMTAYRPVEDLGEWWKMGNMFCLKEDENAYGGYYSKEDIREIVHYAAVRQITVIPEIDMPGHSRDVLCAYPELACDGKDYLQSNELCVGKEATFQFCETVLQEIMELFPSKYIHIGGDEANREIWKNCPSCQKRMHDEHIGSVADLQNYFTNRVETFLNAHGKTMIGWDEILDGDVSKRAVVMSWREEVDGGGDALHRGHSVIMAPTSHCYLDYYQDNPYYEPKALFGYTPLEQTYSLEPIPEGDFDESLVLGVQGNLWTEHISTAEHVEYMVFPRVLAVAEVGWTDPALKSYPDFKERVLRALDYLKSKDFHPFNLQTEMGPRPESLNSVNNLAKGKKVTYLAPFNEEFAGSKEITLTDGRLGNWNANGQRWQGFGGNMDVVIDMEQSIELHAIRASFIQVLTGGVYLPDKVEIFISDNGSDYTQIYSKDVTTDYTMMYDICNFGWVGHIKARYIHFHATKPISWGNILCDEIVIK